MTSPTSPQITTGPLALVGSGEFLSVMSEVDQHLLHGLPQKVAVIPTAAAPEGDRSLERWFRLADEHYTALRCEVVRVDVRDRHHADAPEAAGLLDGCGLIYLSGGNPSYLANTLRGTQLGQAIRRASAAGVAVAGCSAGAMAMGQRTLGVRGPATEGLGLVGDIATIPHFDRFGFARRIAGAVMSRTADDGSAVLGVDEDTAVVWQPKQRTWTVMGASRAWLVTPSGGAGEGYGHGQEIPLPAPSSVD